MKKLLIILFVMAALSGVAFASPQQDCIDRLTPYADQVNEAGLYASPMIAAGMLETGWCSSDAVNYNNYHGIKCRYPPCFSKNTWEVYNGQYWQGKLQFQAFDTIDAEVQAYIDKINFNPIYADVDRTSLDAYIRTLSRHWATDPAYAVKLRQLIDYYDLTQYDRRK
ncbi:MAG: N-acetylmuramoyl-L-alanine amidase [Firmicutes bacterium]|nr:N-acetylmuramoyl-L-alanine amidase [Bacillota bacterium]